MKRLVVVTVLLFSCVVFLCVCFAFTDMRGMYTGWNFTFGESDYDPPGATCLCAMLDRCRDWKSRTSRGSTCRILTRTPGRLLMALCLYCSSGLAAMHWRGL